MFSLCPYHSLLLGLSCIIFLYTCNKLTTSCLAFLPLLFPLSNHPDPVTDILFLISQLFVLPFAPWFFVLLLSSSLIVPEMLVYESISVANGIFSGLLYAFHDDYPPCFSCLQVDNEEFQWSLWYAYLSQGSPAVQLTRVMVIFFRLSQYNSTVYGDAGASASRNITLPVFAYASLSNCPSTSILWQTQLRPNLAVLLSVLR